MTRTTGVFSAQEINLSVPSRVLTKEEVMSHSELLAEPTSTQRLLAKLNQAIDEARLVKKILSLNDELRIIENMRDEVLKIYFLKSKISALESELWTVRNQMV